MRLLIVAALLAVPFSAAANECSLERAWSAVRSEVERSLISPATAQHPDLDEIDTSAGSDGCFWRISAFVDAQNGFGALVRADYSAMVRQRGDDFTVVIRDLQQR